MTVKKERFDDKYNDLIAMLKANPKALREDLQKALKRRFGEGIGSGLISQARREVIALRNTPEPPAASTYTAMKKAGRANRLGLPVAPAALSQDGVLVEHQARDLGQIILRRLPGVRSYRLEVGEDGKATVTYKVVSEKTGTTSI